MVFPYLFGEENLIYCQLYFYVSFRCASLFQLIPSSTYSHLPPVYPVGCVFTFRIFVLTFFFASIQTRVFDDDYFFADEPAVVYPLDLIRRKYYDNDDDDSLVYR